MSQREGRKNCHWREIIIDAGHILIFMMVESIWKSQSYLKTQKKQEKDTDIYIP